MIQYLVTPCVQVHDQVLSLGVPVSHFALVAVGVPCHLLGHVAVLLMLGEQFIVLLGDGLGRLGLQRLSHNHRLPKKNEQRGQGIKINHDCARGFRARTYLPGLVIGGGLVMVQFLGTLGLFSNEAIRLRWSSS
jgi:hypothetical protein